MTNVFIRTGIWPDIIRRGMWEAVRARWIMEPIILTIIDANKYGIREGRALAEEAANSDPYIFTDDDVLIVGKNWVKRAVEMVLACPEYGAVSTLSLVETENTALPQQDTDIYPMHMVGAPMIIRKGLCLDMPEMTLGSECGVIYDHMMKQGKKQGLIHPKHRIRHNHMGHGFSSNPNLHWGA